MTDKQYISTKKAAELTNYNPTTFNNLCGEGKVECHKDEKGRWQISVESLQAYYLNRGLKNLKPQTKAFATGKPYKKPAPSENPVNSKNAAKRSAEIERLEIQISRAQDALNQLQTEYEDKIEDLKAHYETQIQALKLSFQEEKSAFSETAKTVNQQQSHIEKLTDQIDGYASFLKDTLTRLLPTPNSEHNP